MSTPSRFIWWPRGCHAADLGIVVHFVVDNTKESLAQGQELRFDLDPDRFILVRNEGLAPVFIEPSVRKLYSDLASEGEVVLPKLGSRA